jgi:5-methylcytosine-specific restriction protein B
MPNAGPQIFVFTAGNAEAQAHLADSIESPIALDRVLRAFPRDAENEIRRIHDHAGGLYAWGAVPGQQNAARWNQMNVGDWTLCVYGSAYRYVARVLAKFDNENFARDVWGVDEHGRTWNLMYFLSKPDRISIPLSELTDTLHAGYMGFTRISDERLQLIATDFGSVDRFIETRILGASDIPDGITREDVLNAIAAIDNGETAGFGESTNYDLLYNDRRYPPKMVLGLAARRVLGRSLRHTEFSGGEKSKCLRVLRDLGFPIVPKPATEYFLIRSNAESPYSDDLGRAYHFSNSVPNFRKLRSGGFVVVDRKTDQGVRLLGHGLLDPAETKDQADAIHYRSRFRTWHPFNEPGEIPESVAREIRSVPGYNIQHAIRPITDQIFKQLTRTSAVNMDLKAVVDSFGRALEESGVRFGANHMGVVRAFIASVAAKPLVILTGLSGSGKTQIALRFGEWLGEDRLHVAAVRPDWTGPEALFGYEDALKPVDKGRPAWSVPEPLGFLLKAARDPHHPYALLLDEMNLAHVERYFSDVLSGMESGQPCLPNVERAGDGYWRRRPNTAAVPFPSNVFVIGTVNVDETTYMFSPKVLDRANTFEFRVAASDLLSNAKKPSPCKPGVPELVNALVAAASDPDWHIRTPYSHAADLEQKLVLLHGILSQYSFEFGHRFFFEATRFAAFLEQAGEAAPNAVLDRIVMQKILPRLHGSRRRVEVPLLALAHFARVLPTEAISEAELRQLKAEEGGVEEAALPLSFNKICRMISSLRTNQFTSFTE